MKYIFFGTPEFIVIILEKLIKAGLTPEAVICNPDKPVGRKKIITPPPVKQRITNYDLGIRNKIKILQPENLKSYILNLKSFNVDIFIIAAYSQILPKEILEIPRLGAIGVHPSLLPKYRGPTPIQTAILNGYEETGVSLFLIDEKIDHGDILATRHLPLGINDNYESLMRKLAELGAELLIKTLPDFVAGKITPLSQDESQATYTKKFSTQDAYIEPKDLEKAENRGGEIILEINRKIRALNPEPGIWTILNGKRTKLLESKIIDEKLKIAKIQVEGKKPQDF